MPSLSDLDAIWSALIFGGIVGGAWLGGRSKYRDKLIADLQSHNNLATGTPLVVGSISIAMLISRQASICPT